VPAKRVGVTPLLQVLALSGLDQERPEDAHINIKRPMARTHRPFFCSFYFVFVLLKDEALCR